MAKITRACKEVLDYTEWVAIVTSGKEGPHLAATWGEYVRSLGIRDDEILIIPAGHYNKTEDNLNADKNIQLLIASRQVQGGYGPGQGYIIYGEGEIQTKGELAETVKRKFSWARGALVIKIKEIKAQL